ncbi:MAG: translation initiation factor IF-2 N-terminal domain-containing protein [Acidimicrobiales bacterium]
MFLYELAIELDRRSGELIDLAAELGMGVVTASSTLDATQVHQLRARLGPSGGASSTPSSRRRPRSRRHPRRRPARPSRHRR